MKKSSVFWGSFFIVLGLLFLLRQLGMFGTEFCGLMSWWPLLLILFGLSLLKLHDYIKLAIAGAAGVLAGMILFSIITYDWIDEVFGDSDFDVVFSESCYDDSLSHRSEFFENTYSHTFSDKYEYATLNVSAGAGSFFLGDVSDEKLIDVYSKMNISHVDVDVASDSNKVYVDLDMSLHNGRHIRKNSSRVRLNTSPIWDMNFETGAAQMKCDLRKFKVRRLEIEAGAADIEMKLGDLTDTVYVDIEVGAAHIKLLIPKTSDCEIEAEDFVLTSFDFDGFIQEDDYYRTQNSDSTSKKMFIKFEGAIASFEVERY
jgi:hypothetical protein